MAARSKNIFAYLDSDEEDAPKTAPKRSEGPAGAVALNKPAAGNKKTPKKNAAPVAAEKPAEKTERPPREGGRGAARGARGGRGGARGGGGGHRDYDRRSGTGRGRETSKQGGGARNWGNENDQTELTAEAEAQEGKAKEADEEETATGEQASTAVVEEVVEEVQLTLDEYLAKKKEARTGELFAEVEVRQVTDEFTHAVQITKDGKTPDYVEALYEKVYSKKTSGRKKQVITDLGFQSAAPERRYRDDAGGRGGRGGRGGGRGGRGDRPSAPGRGQFHGPRAGTSSAPNVADMSAFPSLG